MSYYPNLYSRHFRTFVENARTLNGAVITYYEHLAFTGHLHNKQSPLKGIDQDSRLLFVICFILEVMLHGFVKRELSREEYESFFQKTSLPDLEWCGHGRIGGSDPYSLLVLLSPKEREVLDRYESMEQHNRGVSTVASAIEDFFLVQSERMRELGFGDRLPTSTLMGLFSTRASNPRTRFEDYVVATIRELAEEYEPTPSVYDGMRENTVVSARPKDGVDGIWIFAGALLVGWGIISLLWQIPSMHEFGRGFGELWLLLSLTFPWLLMAKYQDYVKDPFLGKFVVFSVGVLFLVLAVVGMIIFG